MCCALQSAVAYQALLLSTPCERIGRRGSVAGTTAEKCLQHLTSIDAHMQTLPVITVNVPESGLLPAPS